MSNDLLEDRIKQVKEELTNENPHFDNLDIAHRADMISNRVENRWYTNNDVNGKPYPVLPPVSYNQNSSDGEAVAYIFIAAISIGGCYASYKLLEKVIYWFKHLF